MVRITHNIEAEVRGLAALDRDELAALWAKAHGCPAPKGVRNELLVRSAAWHLQAKRLGGYSAETRRLLKSAIVQAGRRYADRASVSRTAAPVKCRIDIHRGDGDLNAVADVANDVVPDGVGASGCTESAVASAALTAVVPLSPPPVPASGSLACKSDSSAPVPRLDRPRRQRRTLLPGARLLRDWNGRTHVIDVIEGGYVFEARLYASLSAIAREITGTHWSGPRFFGL